MILPGSKVGLGCKRQAQTIEGLGEEQMLKPERWRMSRKVFRKVRKVHDIVAQPSFLVYVQTANHHISNCQPC